MKGAITTLGDVYGQVEEHSRKCFDEEIPVKEISFNSLQEIRIGSDLYPLLPIAGRSITTRMGVPFSYLERCPDELQSTNLNHWIEQEKNEKLFFRFMDGTVRAIFTPRYTPADNLPLIQKLVQMGYSSDTEVQCHLDSNFMLLNIPEAKRAFNIKGNDKLMPGISIANSEVGLSSLSVSGFLLRLVCTNGMICREKTQSFSARHISEKALENFPGAITMAAQGIDVQKDKLKISLESPVASPESTMASFNKHFLLDKKEKEAVEWAWPYEEGQTMFNIIQTYTKAAQFQDLTADQAYNLQNVGGRILSMVN